MDELPRLHIVTNDELLASEGFVEVAGHLLQRGGPAIALHLRGPRTSGRLLWERVSACVSAAERSGAWIVVNDRVDVALACGVRRVQLRDRSLRVQDARGLLGASGTIGVSVHEVGEARSARQDGADFVLAGTLYPSASHPGKPGRGAGWIRQVVGAGVPAIGIGGVETSAVAEVLAAGAAGVAVINGIWGAPDPVRAMEGYLRALEE